MAKKQSDRYQSVAALAAGDLLTIPAGTRARFRNEGAEVARFLLVVLMPRPAARGQHAVVVEEGEDA